MDRRHTLLQVEPAEAGLRIDRLLTRRLPDMNRAKIRHLFDARRLRVNGCHPAGPSLTLESGDRIEIESAPPGDRAAYLLHDEPGFFVAFKPGGVPLARALIAGPPGRTEPARRAGRPRAVLGLDREISGLVIGARQPGILHRLVRQFHGGRGLRHFTALVRGIVPRPSGPLPDAPGWTYRLLGRFRDHALVQILPPTPVGAHPLAALGAAGWPVVPLPGPPAPAAAIHADRLAFAHPRTGRSMRFHLPPPLQFADLLSGLPPAPTLAVDQLPQPPADRKPAETVEPGLEPALRSPRSILQSRPWRRKGS